MKDPLEQLRQMVDDGAAYTNTQAMQALALASIAIDMRYLADCAKFDRMERGAVNKGTILGKQPPMQKEPLF